MPAGADAVFAVEYLPGQFDQRADSAAQCIQLMSQGERPARAHRARSTLLYGALTDEEIAAIKQYVINPVESREASLDGRRRLRMRTMTSPPTVADAGRASPRWTAAELDGLRRPATAWPWTLDDI